MSAVPKKKLCWNCEGNVSRVIDNCPYCGVYLHANEEAEEEAKWHKIRHSEEDDIPSPVYQMLPDEEADQQQANPTSVKGGFDWSHFMPQLKQDLFPMLFLMAGSLFFLFGVVLLLFSQDGKLILEWDSNYSTYFLGAALPLFALGWKYFQNLE